MQTKWLLTSAAVLALAASPALAANDSITKAMKNSQSTAGTMVSPDDQTDGSSAGSPAASSSQSSQSQNSSDHNASDQSSSDQNFSDQSSSDEAASGKPLDKSGDQDVDQSAQNDDGAKGWHRHARGMTQHKLRSALKKAGFTHIRVLDAKYLVQAKDNEGNTVFMAINPPSMSRNGETTGFNGNAGADERSGASRDDETDYTDNADDNRYGGAHAQGGWRNKGGQLYKRGYDQGFREGYSRGFDRGYGN